MTSTTAVKFKHNGKAAYDLDNIFVTHLNKHLQGS